MEFEGYKSIWLNEEKRTSSPSPASVNSARLQLLRSSAYRDWERTREKSRIFFSFLFALSAAGAAFAALPSGTGPIAALSISRVGDSRGRGPAITRTRTTAVTTRREAWERRSRRNRNVA